MDCAKLHMVLCGHKVILINGTSMYGRVLEGPEYSKVT